MQQSVIARTSSSTVLAPRKLVMMVAKKIVDNKECVILKLEKKVKTKNVAMENELDMIKY